MSLLIGGANGNFVFEFEVKIFCEMKRKSVMPNGFKYSWKKIQHSSYVLDTFQDFLIAEHMKPCMYAYIGNKHSH